MARPALRFLLLGAALAVAPALAAKEYSYPDLLEQMIDLKALAKLPAPGEKCFQFSSYDRASTSENDARGWNANADHGKYLRKDGDEYVMAETEGPAAIVRIWSANPQGTLKIYLDGNEEPAVVAPTTQMTIQSWNNPDRTATAAGTQESWIFPEPISTGTVSSAFCGRRAAGWNLYLPIPFQKSLKVTVEKPGNPGSLYYHVNIMRFTPGTTVPTWSMDLVKKHEAAIKSVFQALSNPAEGMSLGYDSQAIMLGPGGEYATDAWGPAAITKIVAKVSAADLRSALREVWVTARFDDAEAPQISTPLGDFFGSMPGINTYASLPLGMSEDLLYSRWYMPFKSSFRIQLVNEGKQDVTIAGNIEVEPITWTDDLGHFHAKWRRTPKNTTFDWPFLECTGRGRVVGVALGIFNPVNGWWGEGDEKVWVDGEAFPSTFGTGSEDYFGYAWCNTALFQHAYHNQTLCEGPGNGNHTSVNRWHIIDSLPFHTSIRFTIEDWPLGNKIGKDYCATAYWYAAPGQKDFFKPVPVAERLPRAAWKPFVIEGLIEGERMHVSSRTGGDAGPQDLAAHGQGWSGAQHLWWQPKKDGEKLVLDFNAPADGVFEVTAYLTKSWDYGTFRLSINGKPAPSAIDLYSGEQGRCVPTGPVALGSFALKKGRNELTVEVAGKAAASPGYYFGLDGIALKEGGKP